MGPNEIAKEIEKLSLAEKLILVEDIWDGFARNNGELPLPEWQKVELDKRYSNYQNGSLKLYDWESIHRELRNKSK